MKSLVRGLMCVGVVCVSVSVARGEGAAAPAGQDEIAALREKVKAVDKKIGEIRAKAAATDEVKALQQKANDAQKALGDARKAKQEADPKYGAAVKAAAEAEAKLNGMGLKMDGLPKAVTKVLSDTEKTEAEAAARARKEAKEQVAAIEKEINASEEMKKLDQAQKDTRKACDAALSAKVAADPDREALGKERDELSAKIRAAKEAAQKK